MPEQPNKPGGDFKPDGKPRDAGDEQAVENQASVTPDDYKGDRNRVTGKDLT